MSIENDTHKQKLEDEERSNNMVSEGGPDLSTPSLDGGDVRSESKEEIHKDTSKNDKDKKKPKR